ncbi:MAG: DUF4375 domain-containing protein [Oscillospiraceae bacterium]|nr:DUF4375 domain-containing protein [Oscillospiraceae bacterium]
MKWIDGSQIDRNTLTGETVCEKLTQELWEYDRSQWLNWPDCFQTAAFLIDFDTELQMEGIFTFLENSIGHYAPEIIKAFRTIGDEKDAEILSEICRLAPPDVVRGESSDNHQEYEISSFQEDHALCEETVNKIEALENQLYLNTDSDIWQMLFAYLDSQL